jgi:type IV pilus assembly protein PilC
MKYVIVVRKEGQPDEKRTVEAESRFHVYNDIHKEGGFVVTLTERGSGPDLMQILNFSIGDGIKTDQRIAFTKNLSAMLKAGLPLSRALSVIERQTKNPGLKKIVLALEDAVKKGTSLHEALAVHKHAFPKLFIAMTKAGEESGTLADALGVIAHQMDSAFHLEKKVKGAMIYPGIILSAILVIGVLMLMFVVPTLSATFASLDADLPLATRIIIGASDFAAQNALVVFVGLGAFFGGIYLFFRSKIGKRLLLMVALRFPGISDIVRETFAARASRTLASLLAAGVDMLNAIDITSEVVGDNVFGAVIVESGVRVKKGELLSAAFIEHSNLYPTFIGDMIAVGEETGKVAEMLGQVATYYETDVEDRTKDLSTIIEPILMLVIGVAVGIFAIAMISPIYSLSSKI